MSLIKTIIGFNCAESSTKFIHINIKTLILIISGIFICNMSYSQVINCESSVLHLQKKELLKVFHNYSSSENIKDKIVLIDYKQKDSVNLYRVTDSEYIFKLINKKPDCYFTENNNICYIYTKKYNNKKDSVWLANIFEITSRILKSPDIEISWDNDSILSIKGDFYINSEYTPPIIEYEIYNGSIRKKKFVNSMFYKSTSKPKGIKLLNKFGYLY